MITPVRACCFAALSLSLVACGATSGRYMLDPPVAQETIRVAVARIEVRDVTLPDYAGASEIMRQSEDGALYPVKGAIWADDPMRAMTRTLARNLDAITTATAAGEPWPLEAYPDVRIETRIERMIARADGQLELSGQYAIASPDRVVRESINRFDILEPVVDDTAGAVAQASSRAMMVLAREIAARLRR